jgi:hypothetical protein
MPTCSRCGKEGEASSMFRHDDSLACRSHLLEFQSIGSLEVFHGANREFVYSATKSELERLIADPTVTDILVRSFEWVSKPRTVSRPLQVSKAYNRKARWVTLNK